MIILLIDKSVAVSKITRDYGKGILAIVEQWESLAYIDRIVMPPLRYTFCYLPIMLCPSRGEIEALDLIQKKPRAYTKVEGLLKVLAVLRQTESDTTFLATMDTGELMEVSCDIV